MIFLLFSTIVELGRICPDPRDAKCAGWTPHDIAFSVPKDGVARDEFRSESFYAIVLKTLPPCSVTNEELAEIQKLFPANKVFATRFGCEGSDEAIHYTNINPKVGFIAVYGGSTAAEARKFLQQVNFTQKFPGANVRKMQAVLVYP